MRTLVISDVHSNLTALEAVIAAAGQFERVWCLGDIVGYGPDPNECIALIRTLPEVTSIMGNHDAAIMGFLDLNAFNDGARLAIEQQANMLTQESRDFLELLDVRTALGEVSFAHGSPRNPIWEYMLSYSVAEANFDAYDTQICLFGHSHVPMIFIENKPAKPLALLPAHADMWRSQKRFMLNPGSVGQPRDHNPKASFVIYDDEEQIWQFQRVSYDIDSVAQRIIKRGLPAYFGKRLFQGD